MNIIVYTLHLTPTKILMGATTSTMRKVFLDNAPYSEYRLVILSQMIIYAQSTTSRHVLPKAKLLVREMCRWYKSDSSPHKV